MSAGAAASLLRAGGISGMALGVGYVVIVALYSIVGAAPSGGGATWLDYLDGKTTLWWGITGLSVVTDLLFLPLIGGLCIALRRANRNLLLTGATLVALFVVLDLAVTWPSYASLITLAGDNAAATADAERATMVAAASYPASVLASSLWAVYAIAVPGLGILALSLVLLRAELSRVAGWAGVLTGILAVASVIGPFFVSGLGALAIAASVLTTVWVLVVGWRLYRLSERPAASQVPAPDSAG